MADAIGEDELMVVMMSVSSDACWTCGEIRGRPDIICHDRPPLPDIV